MVLDGTLVKRGKCSAVGSGMESLIVNQIYDLFLYKQLLRCRVALMLSQAADAKV